MVDDDPDIRRVAELSLERIGGWTVSLASSGAEAIARAELDPPDVVLLDVMMPDMDGPTTLLALQAHPVLGHVPVVFITAKVRAQEIERYLELGAAGVISKPFDPVALPGQIRRILSGERRTVP
jgi:two-component system, OmpR family, response regulator